MSSDEATKRRSDGGSEIRPFVASSLSRSVASSKACFNCCIPLSFIPERSELGGLPGPTGLTDLKTLAIARLMLDNVPHIKAFWIMQGVGLSQVALDWGCDDLDGTVVWYDITKREGEEDRPTHQEMHVEDLKRLIREAGKTPVERDTLYREFDGEGVTEDALATVGAKGSDDFFGPAWKPPPQPSPGVPVEGV